MPQKRKEKLIEMFALVSAARRWLMLIVHLLYVEATDTMAQQEVSPSYPAQAMSFGSKLPCPHPLFIVSLKKKCLDSIFTEEIFIFMCINVKSGEKKKFGLVF